MRESVFVRQAQLRRAAQIVRTCPVALRHPRIFEVGLLIDIEVDIDRIERDQSRQGLDLRCAALDQIAFRDSRPPYTTRNWRYNTCEPKIKFCAAKRRLGGRDASFGFVADCGASVVLFS